MRTEGGLITGYSTQALHRQHRHEIGSRADSVPADPAVPYGSRKPEHGPGISKDNYIRSHEGRGVLQAPACRRGPLPG